MGRYFFATLTDSRLRPRARRRLMTCRPLRVRILFRKPWVRLRRLVCGWYVRFTVMLLGTPAPRQARAGVDA
jgi:hypothetical protein